MSWRHSNDAASTALYACTPLGETRNELALRDGRLAPLEGSLLGLRLVAHSRGSKRASVVLLRVFFPLTVAAREVARAIAHEQREFHELLHHVDHAVVVGRGLHPKVDGTGHRKTVFRSAWRARRASVPPLRRSVDLHVEARLRIARPLRPCAGPGIGCSRAPSPPRRPPRRSALLPSPRSYRHRRDGPRSAVLPLVTPRRCRRGSRAARRAKR